MTATENAQVPPRQGGFRPKEYAHIVLKTGQVDEMIDWYRKVLGMQVVLRTPMINFLTWDDSQDRLAIVPMKETVPRPANAPGMHHAAFEVDSLHDLVAQYRALKSDGIVPHNCVNHGVATSMYYKDPDDNEIELSVESFKTAEQLNEWFATGAFNANPYGVPCDPEELCARLDAGEDPDVINRPHPDHETWLADMMRGKE